MRVPYIFYLFRITCWIPVAVLTFILKPIPNTQKALLKLILILLSLASFALIAGLAPSVVRSVTMFSFVAIGYQLRRSVNVYHTLLVSIFLILLFNRPFI
jgi:competence protein ComEC